MTMPSQKVYALKKTKEFLREILNGPRSPQLVLKEDAYSCLKHYPGDYVINEKWSDEVCEHGNDIEFCQECKPKESMRRVERYGKMVWENIEFEDQRKGNCLCHQCAKMKPTQPDHCKIASKFYEVCKDHGCAFILTRCEDYQKPTEEAINEKQ